MGGEEEGRTRGARVGGCGERVDALEEDMVADDEDEDDDDVED